MLWEQTVPSLARVSLELESLDADWVIVAP
jgi:hypothetical protein